MSGLAMLPSDLAKLASLLVTGGKHAGVQLLAHGWLAAMNATAGHGAESALLWWHCYDTTITVDHEHISALRQAGAAPDVMQAFSGLLGVHRSVTGFFTSVRSALGHEWQSRLPQGVRPFDIQQGTSFGYRAEGDLGQYVLAIPASQLVAVRLIRESTIAREVPNWDQPPASIDEHFRRLKPFLFPEFEATVIALAKQLH